ncbi:MAG: ferrous iron transport protein B, partial [Rubrivivax sp.]|nr:ferrous iron transport protein B [Pyrinomonadaceae bacterium]
SLDEHIASDILRGQQEGVAKPDAIVAVVDATNLERNLYLVTQLFEFGVPVVVALTMIDVFEKQKHQIDIEMLSVLLKAPVVAINAKSGRGREELAEKISEVIGTKPVVPYVLDDAANGDGGPHGKIFSRYNFISEVVQESVWHSDHRSHRMSEKIDRVLTHKVFGLVILVAVLLVIFQTIFSWASLPMDLLEKGFGSLADLVRTTLPEGILADLLADGVVAGVGGVVVFLPQILLLFLFISILEDTGYMARAAFLLDKLMSRVGLHGKAFLPMMSSFACAIPGIMATRTIESRRDRFATIMIAPFMSCSARLPVYTLMIAAFFTDRKLFGFLSVGALLILSMYLLGIAVAVVVAWILKHTILKSPPPPLVLELPPYRVPSLLNIAQTMRLSAWLFLKRAGTVILTISILLWALMTFPRSEQKPVPDAQEGAAVQAARETGVEARGEPAPGTAQTPESAGDEGEQVRQSYAGRLGHFIEPVIRPLGFDWKMGIGLIASFAARETLVSTFSIVYNVGKDAEAESPSLIEAVRSAKRPDGSPAWTPLVAVSMMVFFVLACQCMSTVAVVRRETNSWRWPLFMVGYMLVIAYVASLITYQGGRLLLGLS